MMGKPPRESGADSPTSLRGLLSSVISWAGSGVKDPVTSCLASACPLTVVSWRLGALPLTDLWSRYAALGGDRPRSALAAYLLGSSEWTDAEHNVLAQTLNENLWELGISSLAPHRELRDAVPRTAPRTGRSPRTGGPTGVPTSLSAVAVAERTDAHGDITARTATLWQRTRDACMAAERAQQRAEHSLHLSRTSREERRLRPGRRAQREAQPDT
jgi:hypothetical protein